MNPPFKFIMPIVAGAAILLGLSPATLKAQNNTYYGAGALETGSVTGLDDSAFGFNALYSTNTGGDNAAIGFGARSNFAGWHIADAMHQAGQPNFLGLTTGVRALEVKLDDAALKRLDTIFPGPKGAGDQGTSDWTRHAAPEAYSW